MATAVAAPEEQLVAQPRKVVTFVSRRQNLRLVMKPRRPERSTVSGEVIGEIPGLSIQFDVFIDPVRRQQLLTAGVDAREAQAAARYGRFECPTEGPVALEYGQEVDDATQVYEWLSRHRLNGDSVEGFWRVDPTTPPVTREEMDRIVEAATMHDVETLQAIAEQERAGWAREDLLKVAEGSITRIEEVQAKMRAEIEAEQAAAAESAAKAKPAAEKK